MKDKIAAKAMQSLDKGTMKNARDCATHCMKLEVLATGEDAIAYNRAGVVAASSVVLHYLKKIVAFWQKGNSELMQSWSLPFMGMYADIEHAARAYIADPEDSDRLVSALEYAHNSVCTMASGYRVSRNPVTGKLLEHGTVHYTIWCEEVRMWSQLAKSGILIKMAY